MMNCGVRVAIDTPQSLYMPQSAIGNPNLP
jgi:hypothetical protein